MNDSEVKSRSIAIRADGALRRSSNALHRRCVGQVAAVLLCTLLLAGCGACGTIKRYAYEGFGRDAKQQPARVVETLAIERGQVVADLGAGGGYFTFRLADSVGPEGKVYAIDIDPDMTGYITNAAQQRGYRNVEAILAEPDDPKLAPESVDLIFTVNTYHHITDRAAYFARAKRYLRPGGRVAIIDYRPEGFFQRLFPHSTEGEEIKREMSEAGYRLAGEYDFLTEQNFLVFAPQRDHP
jgi:ubiquinone/menaquinone biosynthesis C-methylase UbiE